MNEQQAEFSGWAKVEVMGHQSHTGYVKTEVYGATVLFRIDTPELPEREYVLTEPAMAQPDPQSCDNWCPVGTRVRRAARPGVTVLVGAGSIYRIIPCSESVAIKSIDSEMRASLMIVGLPAAMAIAAGADSGSEDDADFCEDCGKSEAYCECL